MAGSGRPQYRRSTTWKPPTVYLTGWRLALAADLLREGDDTVESVARAVGYGGSFAFGADLAGLFRTHRV
ncbi:helix-turn-helix transcriptional regulator [Streptomyces halstedii]|uniref:hypothetical protein n=1 Tax=Streptomyces halstedii TaxID=1944 RepID=UPI00380A2AC8